MNKSLFLYTGISLLLVAFVTRWLGVPAVIWIPIFSIAILSKVIFLINICCSKGFKMSLGLMFIFIGVAAILISMLFKYIFPVVWLRNILFYGAITLKITGFILMTIQKSKMNKSHK